jgi:hypothetical protein
VLTVVITFAEVQQPGVLVLAYVLVWGPIFVTIAWATRRALRNRGPRSLKNQRP